MEKRGGLKYAVSGLALLALLGVVDSADAQSRRLPSRTTPIPDTETGRPAGTAEPANPNMMIYGPPVAPLGAPPASSTPVPIPESALKPAPAEPAPPVAAPAPVAVPAPAPAPASPPVAAPAPA